MKKLSSLLAVVVLATTSPSWAGPRGWSHVDRTVVFHRAPIVRVAPDAAIIPVQPEMDAARGISPEQREAWRQRCKPRLSERDPDTGNQRWLWAEPGCEYGPGGADAN